MRTDTQGHFLALTIVGQGEQGQKEDQCSDVDMMEKKDQDGKISSHAKTVNLKQRLRV